MQNFQKELDQILKNHQGTLIIAVDGACASGKTTFSEKLAQQYQGTCFHMDDFYLPFELRTPDRMKEPGGNVHYERLIEEVLAPAQRGQSIDYRSYCSKTHTYSEPIHYPEPSLIIIEGTYALHSRIRNYFNLKLFFEHEPQTQLTRIETRNGLKKRMEFELRWIPLENQYFRIENPKNVADFVVDTSTWF